MCEIPVTEVGPVCIGQTENPRAATGCTVFIAPKGMCAGLDVRGGGPASRESQLLNPLMAAQSIHAIVLAGGSAYGLGAANGVMRYLEQNGIGYDTGYALVPLVVQSDIYDLSVGDASIRPDADMGYEAARRAMEDPNYKDGNYGAGCGATVGKYAGMDYCMKSGIGSYAIQIGELKIGAVVVLNALGDVYDWKTGRQIAGMLNEEKDGLRSTAEYMRQSYAVVDNKYTGNTTIWLCPVDQSRPHVSRWRQHLCCVNRGYRRGPGYGGRYGGGGGQRSHHPRRGKRRRCIWIPGTAGYGREMISMGTSLSE